MSLASTSTIRSERASSYLQQLCKHFGHRIEVEFDAGHGRISFDFGRCELVAENDALTMSASADDQESLQRVEDVVGSHLERFTFREKLEIAWVRESA